MNDNFIRNKEFFEPKQDVVPSKSISGPKKKKQKVKTTIGNTSIDGWPQHFISLEKTFKAMNTVLTFCSTQAALTATFDQIVSSIEGLLKRNLDLFEIAQIKTIIPDNLKFAYVNNSEVRLHTENQYYNRYDLNKVRRKDDGIDIYGPPSTSSDNSDGELSKQVLVLEFTDYKSKLSRSKPSDISLGRAPTLSKTETLTLIEKRNDRFRVAVNELLTATAEVNDDPIKLTLEAAHSHVPAKSLTNQSLKNTLTKTGIPSVRPSIFEVVSELQIQEWYKDQISFHKSLKSREAIYSELDLDIPLTISQGLRSTFHIETLYAHQAQAIQALKEGNNVIVSTSTASGKSIIYTLPFILSLYEHKDSKALFIFPTKALAQDQNSKLQHLLQAIVGMQDVIADTFDGDTTHDKRDLLRENASLLFTNFDTIHHTILPKEDKWRNYLANLRYVVVDELHYYSGVQGTHVAFVMRRLRRLCAALGNNNVKFISTSATIGNPVDHFKTLFGVNEVSLVNIDGAPSGQKEFLIWEPALIDELQPNGPKNSPMYEASNLFRYLISRGVRSIVFCKHRKVCELLMKNVRYGLSVDGRLDLLSRVVSYRGGYNQDERRRIEKDLFSGHLLGAVATNALELGIDVGALDAVICLGFPFSLSSLRQQMGRAGRARRDSLAILVAENLPLDNYYSTYPEEIFTRKPNDLNVDLDNDVIFETHLQCAADELPISLEDDSAYFNENKLDRIANSKLDMDHEGWYHCDPRLRPYPSNFVKLRGSEESFYKVFNIHKNAVSLIEQVEESRAVFELYEGGIFFNAGFSYQIYEVSHDTKTCRVKRVDVNFNTKPRDYTDIDPIKTLRKKAIKGSKFCAYFGEIKISTHVFGYFKLRDFKVLDVVALDTPPYIRQSNGLWLDIPPNVIQLMTIKSINPAEAIQAAQHALMGLTPLYTMSTEGDIRTDEKKAIKEYKQTKSQRKRPGRLILYDAVDKGSGISMKAFEHISDLLHHTLDTILNCDCIYGCPGCVQGEIKDGHASTSKIGAIVILSFLTGRDLNIDDVPNQQPSVQQDNQSYYETVIQAETSALNVELEGTE